MNKALACLAEGGLLPGAAGGGMQRTGWKEALGAEGWTGRVSVR